MMPNFDPSKMDPKLLMELSNLIQQLPPDRLNQMQKLMHNTMAGFDVRKEMEEFEKSLPPDFRQKMMALVGSSGYSPFGGSAMGPEPVDVDVPPAEVSSSTEMNVREARLTVLRAVAEGKMTPEEAEKIL